MTLCQFFALCYAPRMIDTTKIKAAGLSVKGLGELTGIDPTAISRAVNQTRTGPTYTLVRLAVAVWPLLDDADRAAVVAAMRED